MSERDYDLDEPDERDTIPPACLDDYEEAMDNVDIPNTLLFDIDLPVCSGPMTNPQMIRINGFVCAHAPAIIYPYLGVYTSTLRMPEGEFTTDKAFWAEAIQVSVDTLLARVTGWCSDAMVVAELIRLTGLIKKYNQYLSREEYIRFYGSATNLSDDHLMHKTVSRVGEDLFGSGGECTLPNGPEGGAIYLTFDRMAIWSETDEDAVYPFLYATAKDLRRLNWVTNRIHEMAYKKRRDIEHDLKLTPVGEYGEEDFVKFITDPRQIDRLECKDEWELLALAEAANQY